MNHTAIFSNIITMISITIHKLDEELESSLRRHSQELGLSLNKTIQILLRSSLGIGSGKKRDLSKFSGTWSKAEFEEFKRNTAAFDEINPADWL